LKNKYFSSQWKQFVFNVCELFTGEWSFKKSGSRKILAEFQGSRSPDLRSRSLDFFHNVQKSQISRSRNLKSGKVSVSQRKTLVSQSLDFTIRHPLFIFVLYVFFTFLTSLNPPPKRGEYSVFIRGYFARSPDPLPFHILNFEKLRPFHILNFKNMQPFHKPFKFVAIICHIYNHQLAIFLHFHTLFIKESRDWPFMNLHAGPHKILASHACRHC